MIRFSYTLRAEGDTRFAPGAFDDSIGRTINFETPWGQATGTLRNVEVVEGGRAAILGLELGEYSARLLQAVKAGVTPHYSPLDLGDNPPNVERDMAEHLARLERGAGRIQGYYDRPEDDGLVTMARAREPISKVTYGIRPHEGDDRPDTLTLDDCSTMTAEVTYSLNAEPEEDVRPPRYYEGNDRG